LSDLGLSEELELQVIGLCAALEPEYGDLALPMALGELVLT